MADILANGARLASARRQKQRELKAAAAAAEEAEKIAAAPEIEAAPPKAAAAAEVTAAPVSATDTAANSSVAAPAAVAAADPGAALTDEQILAALAICKADWNAAPAKLRALLLAHGMSGVSEKRLKRLKQVSQADMQTASSVKREEPPAPAADVPSARNAPPPPFRSRQARIEERSGRGRCVLASTSLRPGTPLSDFCGEPFAACLLEAAHARHCEACFKPLQQDFGQAPSWLTCECHVAP